MLCLFARFDVTLFNFCVLLDRYSYEQLEKFAAIIKEKTGSFHPSIGIIAGSGQGVLVEAVQNAITIPYTDIEGFPQSTGKCHVQLMS